MLVKEDISMYITDKIIPMVIGKRDKRTSKQDSDNLLRQAMTYRNTLDAGFRKKERALAIRRLAPLKKRIKPLEVDHDRFLRAVEDKKREIMQYPGVSDEEKIHLAQSAANAEYTL